MTKAKSGGVPLHSNFGEEETSKSLSSLASQVSRCGQVQASEGPGLVLFFKDEWLLRNDS